MYPNRCEKKYFREEWGQREAQHSQIRKWEVQVYLDLLRVKSSGVSMGDSCSIFGFYLCNGYNRILFFLVSFRLLPTPKSCLI